MGCEEQPIVIQESKRGSTQQKAVEAWKAGNILRVVHYIDEGVARPCIWICLALTRSLGLVTVEHRNVEVAASISTNAHPVRMIVQLSVDLSFCEVQVFVYCLMILMLQGRS